MNPSTRGASLETNSVARSSASLSSPEIVINIMYISEYLPRLEQISVSVEIPKAHNAIKSISLRDGKIILETGTKPAKPADSTSGHGCDAVETWENSESFLIHLPVRDAKKLDGAKITKISLQNGTLALALSLGQPQNSAHAPFTALPSASGIWSVSDLLRKTPRDENDVSQFTFCCSSCGRTVVDSNSHKFIDMPSEYWHEMMDFWHCHKPHEDHHDIDINEKNYNSKLNPKAGFVHVGSSYVLTRSTAENCSCGYKLGTSDGEALRINKWRLTLRYAGTKEVYAPYYYVYFAILDRINSAGIRKFTIKNKDSSNAFNVWVTGAGLDVAYGTHKLGECLKVLYAAQTDENNDDLIEIEGEIWESFAAFLAENNALLPNTHRTVELKDGDQDRSYKVCYLSPQRGDLDM